MVIKQILLLALLLSSTPLEIITISNPTLRLIAQEVSLQEIGSQETQQFIDNMIVTLKRSGGVGLAAPQVDISKRIFIMESGASIPLTIVINPKITYLESYGRKNSKEGCLSIPGKRVRVKRYKRIHLEYIDRHGEMISEEIKGFKAIIAQHEFDHLNGTLIIDHADLKSLLINEDHIDYLSIPLM